MKKTAHINLAEVASTNSIATQWIQQQKINSDTLLIAENQICGRGQKQNSWHSRKGDSITVSFVFFPDLLSAKDQFAISKAICMGTASFLKKYAADVAVKWPNDLFVKNKKIGGILIEHTIIGKFIRYAICGIGININNKNFPGEYSATSLQIETNKEYEITPLIKELEQQILSYYQMIENKEFAELDKQYHLNLYKKGSFAQFKDQKESFEALVIGVNKFGQLQLKRKGEEQIRTYNFKEVSLIV